MKVNAKDLFEVVRQVVREELRKSLPGMIREHLTETYVRRMVSETVKSGPAPVSELLSLNPTVDEEVPSPQANSDLGIYNPANPTLRKNEVVSKLMTRSNPMAFVYEDVKIPQDGPAADEGIRFKAESAPEFERMNRLVEAVEAKSADRKTLAVNAEAKMRELEMRRRELDSKKVG